MHATPNFNKVLAPSTNELVRLAVELLPDVGGDNFSTPAKNRRVQ